VRVGAVFGVVIGPLLSAALIFFLAFPLRGFGSDDLLLLYAPELMGDSQTSGWRIINQDEAQKTPWTAIGNFLIPGLGGYCSAVLVAPRVVMTANHCLYALDYRAPDANGNPTTQRMHPTLFVFVAGMHDSSFAIGFRSRKSSRADGSRAAGIPRKTG